MKLRAVGDRVIVRRVPEQETVRNGIFIPDAAKEKPQEGEVVAVGYERSGEFQVGERVLFGKYSGVEIKVEGEEFLILREEEILAVVEKGPA